MTPNKSTCFYLVSGKCRCSASDLYGTECDVKILETCKYYKPQQENK